MPRIITPFGNFELSEDGQRHIELAIATGGRYSIKIDNSGVPVFLTGHVRRHRQSTGNYKLVMPPRP